MISYFNSALTSFYDWIGKVLDALIPVKMNVVYQKVFKQQNALSNSLYLV